MNPYYDDFLLSCHIAPEEMHQSDDSIIYAYQTKSEANEQLAILIKLLEETYPDLNKTIHEQPNQSFPFGLRLSKAQHETLNQIRYQDRLIKTLRWDENCFIDTFIHDITHFEGKDIAPRKKPRPSPHRSYTVFASGVYKRDQKPSPYPSERLAEKEYLSPHQSTTLITRDAQVPVFGLHRKSRNEALIGMSFNPDEALINRMFTHDTGTVKRPYEFSNEKQALQYHQRVANKTLFNDKQTFKEAIKNTGKTNEVLALVRYNLRSTPVEICSDTFESRCAAQIFKDRTLKKLKQRALENQHPWDERYEAPIIYYIPGHPKHRHIYTIKEQQADRDKANKMSDSQNLLDNSFAKNEFSFLGLISDLEKAKQIVWHQETLFSSKAKEIRIVLLEKGLTHIAEHFFESKKNLVLFAIKHNCYNKSLFAACRNGDIELIKLFLEDATFNINIKGEQGITPLYIAAKNNCLEVVNVLLESNKFDIKNPSCYEPLLYIAALKGNVEIVRVLLERTDINRGGFEKPLQAAIINGHVEVVKAFIERKAVDINTTIFYKGYEHITPLDLAAKKGHIEIVETILEKNRRDGIESWVDYASPLNHAIINNRLKVVRAFLTKYIDINQYIIHDRTSLFIAAESGNLKIVLELLKKDGININKSTRNGVTPLFIAAAKGHIDVVNALLAEEVLALEREYKLFNSFIFDLPLRQIFGFQFLTLIGVSPLFIAKIKGFHEIAASLKKASYEKELKNRADDHYKTSISLFGKTYNFGSSADVKRKAFNALQDVINGKSDESVLTEHEPVLKQGKLGEVYDDFKQGYFNSVAK